MKFFDREQKLSASLNSFLQGATGQKELDFYQNFKIEDILALKTILSDVNNLLTLKLTLHFIEFLQVNNIISSDDSVRISNNVRSTNTNANGFDVFDEKTKIIAEVKCNVPITGGAKFGVSQRKGIIKDIHYLASGKRKVSLANAISDYFRFLIIIDSPYFDSAFNGVMKYLAKEDQLNQNNFDIIVPQINIVNKKNKIDTTKINIISLKL